MPLGRTYRNSELIFRYMLQTNWLDRLTRVLFVEFLTYSASSNLFSFVTIIFEYCPTGYVSQNLNVSIHRIPHRKTSLKYNDS